MVIQTTSRIIFTSPLTTDKMLSGNEINLSLADENFDSMINKIKETRLKNIHDGHEKPSVVILGAGPAGLIHAMESVIQGNPTIVIEKRSQECPGRENAVLLRNENVDILKFYGIYQYLLKNNLIYPPSNPNDGINVRLKDLEETMKFILSEISAQEVILYDSQATEIIQQSEKKIDIRVQSSQGENNRFSNIDILLNTEGAHSNTHENLLHFEREVLLPSVPVLAAIFKDDRPNIVDAQTLVTYAKKTFVNTVKSIYYHSRFLFNYLPYATGFYQSIKQNREMGIPLSFPGPIKGAVALATPGQNYVGAGLGLEESNKLEALCRRVEDSVKVLKQQKEGDDTLCLTKEVDKAKNELNNFLEYWAKYSVCWVNSMEMIQFFAAGKKPELDFVRPLEQANVAYIGVDRSRQPAGMYLGNSIYLVAGDAYGTTDATTGRGCNTAIEAVTIFKSLTENLKLTESTKALKGYSSRMKENREGNTLESVKLRAQFRPDTVSKVANFKIYAQVDSSENLSGDEMIILKQWSRIEEIDKPGLDEAHQALNRMVETCGKIIIANNCSENWETEAAMRRLNYLNTVVSELKEKYDKRLVVRD